MNNCKCCDGGTGKDIRVSFCPSCKSRSVGYVFGLGNLFGVIPKMKCRECGFASPTFPVLIVNEDELKKAVEGMKVRAAKRKASKKRTVKILKKKMVRPTRQRVSLEGKKK